jgi:hypothetical protein
LGAFIGLSGTRRLTRNMHHLHRRTAPVSLTHIICNKTQR